MPNCYPLLYKKLVVTNYLNKTYKTIKELINFFNISNSSLYNWINLYNKNLLTAKKTYKKKSKITNKIKNYIKQYITKTNLFNYKQLINDIYNKYQLKISKSSFYNTLNELNLTKKKIRTKFVYKTQQKHKNEIIKFKNKIKSIKQNNIISIDETHIDTNITSDYGWSEKGKRINKVKYIKCKKRYTIIAAISNSKIINYKTINGSANKYIFLEFIKEIINNNHLINKYLLVDNAGIHHARIVKEYIQTTSNKLLFNVPYMPEYNPIEKVFSEVKAYIKSKNDNYICNKLMKYIRESFNTIDKDNLKKYYNKSLEIN